MLRNGAQTVVTGRDAEAELTLDVMLRLDATGVLGMSTRLTNVGGKSFSLERCMAGTMLVAAEADEAVTFAGAWGREFQLRRERIGAAAWIRESRRGRTSHDRFPGLILQRAGAGGGLTDAGGCWGIHLGWSGNHILAVDRTDDGRLLVHAGELFEPGEIILAPGESYQSPVAYLAWGRDGESLGAAFRTESRTRLLRFPERSKARRPVTFNTWEGNYFAHDLTSLLAQADAAAALGIERFVLDDGWFAGRDDDRGGLGDWIVDRRKYPDGLGPLIDRVTSRGMEFGLWFEPEMVNPNSDLYRAHPDWVLAVEGRPLLLSRNQLVLDLTRQQVSDHLFQAVSTLLSTHRIAFVKWDMNRDLTHAGGADGRAAISRQTRAVYGLIDRIRVAHPDVEIESCASGGGRADYGILARTHRIWTSDCTDALERLEIQRGARIFFPAEILGAHVSPTPNHQTHRRHSLAFRALVALAYHFGVELNPLTLAPEETSDLRGWIALHKRLRPLLHDPAGQFQLDPADGRYAWGAHGRDKIVLIVAQGPVMIREQAPPLMLPAEIAGTGALRIAGQHPSAPGYVRISNDQKRLLSGKMVIPAAQMTVAGLPLPMLRPESGVVLEFDRMTGG